MHSMTLAALRACLGPDRWRSLTPVDLLLVRHDADCGYVHAGRAYAPLADTVGDWAASLGFRVRSVAAPYSRLRGEAAAHDPVTINRPMLTTALLGRALRVALGTSRGIARAEVRRTRLWKRLLRRARPSVVIGINPEPSLCRAGRHLSIPVFDLQHGLIGNETPWYGIMTAAPAGADYLPAGILCWDEASAVEVGKWARAQGVTTPVLGNPWIARFQEAAPDDEVLKAALAGLPASMGERPRILVSLQWGLGDLYYREQAFNGVLADALEQAILATAGRFDWLLRLHPVQLRGDGAAKVEAYLRRTFSGLAGVEWQRASSAALPALLRSVTAHVTDSSSVVAEAARFGVPSAMLNPALAPGGVFAHLCSAERQAGLAKLIEQDAAAIVQWIEGQLHRPALPLLADGGRAEWMAFLEQFATDGHRPN
jgi:hypothetical protein